MLCVIAKLDDTATERLAKVQKAVGDVPKPLYGHITLATCTGADEADFVRLCKRLLANTAPFAVRHEKIGILDETSIVAALAEKTGTLALLHERIADGFGVSLDRWTRGDLWCPHTTLFYGPDSDLQRKAEKMALSFIPFIAEITDLEFSRVKEKGFEIVDRIGLSRM